jgi:phosphate acetyltransferase
VSSVFFMCLPDEVVLYGDCAINPRPDAEDLADIAIQSAASARAFGIEPRVAMISFSTGTSGTGIDVDKVAEATRIVREREPGLAVDGPLQYDAAAIASVAQNKRRAAWIPGRAAWAARCPQARALRMMLRAWPSVCRGLRNGSCYGRSHGQDSC